MAKGQGGRRRPAGKRGGGGAGRVLLAFVAGVLVTGGVVAWWLQRGSGTSGIGALSWSVGLPGGKSKTAAAPGDAEGSAVEAPQTRAAVPAPVVPTRPAAANENGAAGVPGEPARAGVGGPPFGESEEVFEAGARVYGAQCASCHGRPGRAAAAEKGELAAGQFWTAEGGRAVARQPVGQIFRAIAEGQPQRQMPAYRRVLTDAQMWDVALLLKNAGGELPDPVLTILRTGR